MPFIGYGTTHKTPYCHDVMEFLLTKGGYTHIDTAHIYGTEKVIGEDIQRLKISREKLFLTSKLFVNQYGRDEAKKAFYKTLEKLQTDYLDLYLIHWPESRNHPDVPLQDLYRETWGVFEELYESKKCRAIGVINFEISHLEILLSVCTVAPMVNQIEVHPYCYDADLIRYCQQKSIVVVGYSPIAKGRIFSNDQLHKPILKMAEHYGKTSAQILLRWCIQHVIPVVVKSNKNEHNLENMAIFDFEISDEDMQKLDELHKVRYLKVSWNPKTLKSAKINTV